MKRRLGAAATALLLLAFGSPGHANGAPPTTFARTASPAATVTLITGDRVQVNGDGTPSVIRAPGRAGVPMRIGRSKGHLSVVPADAAAMIASGQLDARLFDVTTLLADGYDDAHHADLPLIVRYRQGADRATAAAGTVRRQLPSINGSAVTMAKSTTSSWWEANTRAGRGGRALAGAYAKIWLDGKRRVTDDVSAAQIGAPAAYQAGLTGRGVRVAIIDSGIDTSHPDLAGRVDAAANFTTEPVGDHFGHGTHVASIVAGTGAASGGKYRGIAPDARLLDAKVCDQWGFCAEDAIVAGMEWAAVTEHAQVANLSLGGTDTPGIDPLEQAVDTLSAQTGTLFVVAAGNSGPSAASVGSPGSADAALTVGAVDRQDTVAEFSSRGPRAGDSGLKPDLTAPGVAIVAARAAGTELGDVVDDHYVSLSGTSMATPHVAGAAAILLQEHPDWTGAQLKAALVGSAQPVDAGVFDQGAGRVDVARAIAQQVTADPATLSYGLAAWPHGDDLPLAKTVTYHNTGSAEVTVDLALNVAGPDGNPAPAQLFTLSADHLTLPAGGTADVTVTADTRPTEVPVGQYTGRLVATGPGTAVTTAVAVEKESEHYNLTIDHIGRDGQALAWYVTFLDRVGDCDPDGSPTACGGVASTATGATLRLPPGDYSLADFASGTGDDHILMMDPDFHLTADSTVTLDTNRAQPVTLSAPRPSAKTMFWELNVARDMHRSDGTIFDYFDAGDGSAPLYTADLATAKLSADDLVSFVDGRLAEPGPTGDFTDSRYDYEMAHSTPGAFFTGLHLAPRQDEFATVNARYAAVTDQPQDLRTDHSVRPVGARQELLDAFWSDPGGPGIFARTPFARTEYYLADGLQWRTALAVGDRTSHRVDLVMGETEFHRYLPGHTYQPPRWVQGVFGPHLGDQAGEIRPADTLTRQGDLLAGGIDMFVDSGARRWGISKINVATARLYRDGQLVQEWPSFTTVSVQLPQQEATYRLEAVGKQPMTQVSTTVISDWTFRSGHLDGADSHPLPLLGVRYDPVLDEHNHAEPRTGYRVPIHLARQAGAGTATVTRVTLEVSSDDGKTWRPAPVIKDRAGWVSTVDNPAGGAVSLRIHARDSDGNTLDQTTIRAYLVNS